MCGIAGYLDASTSTPAEKLHALAALMSATLRHRGPDDEGSWVDPDAGVALGHTRLAILDLSREGRQPMVSGSGRYVIVFNGEIYNFADLRRDLQTTGVRFRGTSDTEVLLAAIDAWGIGPTLARANGMFAFALWDRDDRELTLARDRLGEKPLYYGWSGTTFLFASELKAVRAHPAFEAEIDRDALTLFLRYGYVPAPYSIYRGITKLPPGTTLTLRVDAAERPSPVAYWSVAEVAAGGLADPVELSADDAADALEELLGDSVRRRMVADVPLGAFLSGGIDSSTVVALMRGNGARPVRTFTIGFKESGFDEARHAKAVAAHLGTDHTELYLTSDEAMTVVPTLPRLYDEPYADSSQIPTVLISDLARRHVTVALSGDGGDEVLGGYTRYLFQRRLWSRLERLPPAVRRGLARAIRGVPPSGWDRLAARLGPLLPRTLRHTHPGEKAYKLASVLEVDGADARYRRLISHWPEPSTVVVGGSETADGPVHPPWAAEHDVVHRMMYLDTVNYLPDDILVKVDRASMSRSLEVRVPFLDHRLVEFAWRLPLELKIHDDLGKWLLRRVLYRHVPAELVERPKMGFAVPVGEWLRGRLRPWAEELLDERRLLEDGFIRPEPVRRAWGQHLAGRSDWSDELWVVLMFQAWLQEERRSPVAVSRP